MKLTKKDRLKFYKKSYHLIHREKERFICDCFGLVNNSIFHTQFVWFKKLPEFEFMSPLQNSVWWSNRWKVSFYSKKAKEYRLTVLAFCIVLIDENLDNDINK